MGDGPINLAIYLGRKGLRDALVRMVLAQLVFLFELGQIGELVLV